MIKKTKYQDKVNEIYSEVKSLFSFSIDGFSVKFAADREEYNKLVGKKTEDWMIGDASGKSSIVILDPETWRQYSPMHKPKEFSKLLKHEIVHLFVGKISNGRALPVWFEEGLAGAISGQHKNPTPKGNYFELDFCRKLDTYRTWSDMIDFGAYELSAYFCNYLIKKYGFEKIKKLLSSVPGNYVYYRFDNVVKSIFGKQLEEIEKDFLEDVV